MWAHVNTLCVNNSTACGPPQTVGHSQAMKLTDYIAKIGDEAFAEKFGITRRAALSYRLRERRPKPELAARIVQETPVTWKGIYVMPATAADELRTP